jgi:polar amino acid transport system substrate-binding protein
MLEKLFIRPQTMAVLALLLAAPAFALTASDYCSGPVRVGLFEYGALYRSATRDGIDISLLQQLEKRTGCLFESSVRPRARIWKELEAGTMDLTTAAVATPERSVYLYFVPYLQTRNYLFVRKGEPGRTLTPASFEEGSQRLAVVRSFRYETAYEGMVAKLAAQGRVVEAADVSEQWRMLERKVVDATLSQPVVSSQYLKDARTQREFSVYDWAPAEQSSVGSLALSRKSFSAEQARNWDALLVSMQRDGTLLKLLRKHLDASASQDLVYTGRRLLE